MVSCGEVLQVDIALFVRGVVIGVSIAAPVGPIGVLIIRRTLAEGRLAGFITGLGAATADGFYGAVAGFGLTMISALLVGQQFWFRLVGGLFLCYLGLRVLLAQPAEEAANVPAPNLWTAYASTFLLTLANPMTIISFAAVMAGVGVGSAGETGDYGAAALFVGGVFIGSALWWLLISFGLDMLRMRVSRSLMLWINRISGIVLLGFGGVALLSLLS